MSYERYPKTVAKESFIATLTSAARIYVYLNLPYGCRVITMLNKFSESLSFYMNSEFSE